MEMYTYCMGTTKRIALGFILLFSCLGMVVAQDSIPEQTDEKPLAKAAFESNYFISDQTVSLPPAKTLELVIQHDFGSIQQKWSDLWGIWGSSNIRIGFNYTLNKNLQIGFGTTKFKRIQDLSIKYIVARQRQGGFPVTVTLFGTVGMDCRNKSFLGNNRISSDFDFASNIDNPEFRLNLINETIKNDTLYGLDYITYTQATGAKGANSKDLGTLFDETFKASHRFSYFAEVMIARRFCKQFSAQLGVSWVHYNLVDQAEMTNNHVNGMKNDNINISGIGKIKISPQTSIMLSYSQPVLTYLNTAPWPNAGLGVEVSTSTHAFQVFLTSASGLVPQEAVMYNYNNPYNGYLLLGFNITRLWTF